MEKENEMLLLTNSSCNIYGECPRKYKYMVVEGYRPVKDKIALAFGKAWHLFLELRGKGYGLPVAIARATDGLEDPYMIAMLHVLGERYEERYKNEPIGQPERIERQFKIDLINPRTGKPSRTFKLAGKIDGGEFNSVIEHKTTATDISDPSASYWMRLQLDGQISGYYIAAEVMGDKPEKVIYDVVRKPQIRPLKATPTEARKYKKDGTLYANQRVIDETPQEYAQRLFDTISEAPEKYFQRREIARLESDIVEYMEDKWSTAKLIMESMKNDFYPRRTNACMAYSTCPFFQVCAKMAKLSDTDLFEKVGPNPELAEGTN